MTTPKFKENDRVILLANEDDDIPEQRGVVLEYYPPPADVYMVCIDEDYREESDVDGLVECPPEDLVAE